MRKGEAFNQFQSISEHAIESGMPEPQCPQCDEYGFDHVQTQSQNRRAESVDMDAIIDECTNPGPNP